MFNIIFTPKAEKQLKKLPHEISVRILSALERIRIRPEAYVTKLIGLPGYKLRVGDYRVILDIDSGKLIILVVKIGHRKNIYRDL